MTEIIARFRQLDGGARVVERTLLTALAVVGGLWATQVHHYLPFAFFNEQYLGVFLALGLAPVFVCVRAGGAASLDRVPWYDWLLTAGALVVGGYVAVFYPTIAYTLGIITWDKLLLGVLAIALVLEGVRRLGADVDRARVRALREVRVAAAGCALCEGLDLAAHRRLPLPR